MDNSIIVDKNGLPIKKAALSTPLATPSVTGVRNIFAYGSEADKISPARLASLLRDAVDGDATAYLTLAEEMEEKDLHYASVLGTRKRAISGLDVIVEAAGDDSQQQAITDAVRQLINMPEFSTARDELLDGLGKGYSVVEINWDTKQTPWQPKNRWHIKDGQVHEQEGYIWRDPRFFKYDNETGRKLRLIDDDNSIDGIPLAPYRFIVHEPKLKTGLPIRGGLARLVATAYMCKSYTVTDWLAFAEVFGMPLRVGKYGPGATQPDINTLINAVANIGTDAAAVIPESMRIDFESPGNTQGAAELFKNLAEWLDRQVSKAVLGQTASSEGTPGKLGNEDSQEDVRQDILKADCKALDATLNRDLVRAFVDLNFGQQNVYPRIVHQITEAEDTKALADTLGVLVPLGLEVEQSVIREKLGIPTPKAGAKLLASPQAPDANQSMPAALNQQVYPSDQALEQDYLSDWQQQIDPVLEPIRKLLEQSDTAADFAEGLGELLDEMDDSSLIEKLALAMFKQHINQD